MKETAKRGERLFSLSVSVSLSLLPFLQSLILLSIVPIPDLSWCKTIKQLINDMSIERAKAQFKSQGAEQSIHLAEFYQAFADRMQRQEVQLESARQAALDYGTAHFLQHIEEYIDENKVRR